MQLFQTGINGLWNVFDARYDLGSHKEFLTRDFALFYCDANFLLGIINLCRVEVEVAELQGDLDGIDQRTIGTAIIRALVPGSPSWSRL